MQGPILPGEDLTTVRNVAARSRPIPTRTKPMAYQYSAFYGIKQNKGGYFITEQTCVVGDTYDDAVTKALYMQPQGEELVILERIAPAYD
jgi:hypothetical protein